MGNTIVIGKVGITPRGAWSASVANYEYLDTVTTADGMYIVISRTGFVPAGTLVTNGTYYLLITGKGGQGWTPKYTDLIDTSTTPGTSRYVKQLTDYIGGTGTKPTANINDFLGAGGYVSFLAQALDFRGVAGPDGAQVVSPTGTVLPTPTTKAIAFVSGPATYTFTGGSIAVTEKLTQLKWDGSGTSWSIGVAVPIAEGKMLPWSGKIWTAGSQVIDDGLAYEAVVTTTSLQKPGVVPETVWKKLTGDNYKNILDANDTIYPNDPALGYVGADGVFVTSSAWRSSPFIPVKQGDVVTYVGNIGTTTNLPKAILGYTAAGVFVTILLDNVTETSPKTITIPSGIGLVRMSATAASTPVWKVTRYTYKVNNFPATGILEPLSILTDVIIPPILTAGYIGTAGQFVPSASGWRSTAYTPVSVGDLVKLTGFTRGASAVAAMLYTEDKATYQVLFANSLTGGGNASVVPAVAEGAAPWAYLRMCGELASNPVFTINRYMAKKTALPVNLATLEKFPEITLSCFGDSITRYPDTDPTITNGGWIAAVENNMGFAGHINYGVGGTEISEMYASMIAGAGQTVNKVNTLFIGTNNWTSGSLIGNFLTDYVGNSGANNFAAWYRKCIDYTKSKVPGCINILVTPMYRGAVAGTTKPESNVAFLGQTLLQFVDMVKQIAAYEGYGVVDLFTRGPINHGNCDIRTGPYQVCQDGVHPNDRGYDGVAKIMLPVFRAVVFK